MEKPLITIENGRKTIAMALTIDSQARRLVSVNVDNRVPKDQLGQSSSADETAQDGSRPTEPGIEKYWWRLISAVQAWPSTWYGPQLIDYTHNNAAAIREAVGLINTFRPPVMMNHTEDMRNQVGSLSGAVWEDSTDIPPGVCAYLETSEQFDRKTTVGLRNGFINAGSITLYCEFELSHPDMDIEQFVTLQGRAVDGQVVRWLPTETKHVGHFALVPAGADPNARPRNETGNTRADQSAGSVTIQEDTMDALEVLASVCRQLGIEVVLAKGTPIPERLEARLGEDITALSNASQQFNSLTADIQAVKGFVAREGEANLTAAEILKRLPARLELAAHGEAYLEALRTEACKWYGLAKFDAQKREATDLEKRQLDRMRQSCSVEELRDWIDEYRPAGQGQFGANHRTSQGEELPVTQATPDGEQRRIDAQWDRWRPDEGRAD